MPWPGWPFGAAAVGLVLVGVAAAAHPSGSPATTRLEDEREAKRERTWEEVRRIVAEFHAALPPDRAAAVGAAYARYSSRHQDSVADQVRAIYADAVRKGVHIPLDHVFLDLAVRGVKNDRPGLNALRTLLNRRTAQVVFFFATNRLFRKTYRSLQFVEEQVVDKGVRVVFVKSGVDTADGKRWRGLLNMHAMMDEFVVGMTADHIRAAHEGLLDKRLVFGTISFGYAGRLLDGPPNRRGKPRLALVIDDVAGEWVRRVFEWYVGDRAPVAEIVRRLNADPAVPPPPRSPRRTWTRDAVRHLLRNPRYRGCWRYGVTETVWVSSKDYARQVTRREPLKEVRVEELRLVPDDRWHAAQALLAGEAARVAGRKSRDGDGASRPRVLGGLFWCPAHDRKLSVGGVNGKYLVCKDCRGLQADRRPLYSQLPRARALRKTCERLADLLRADGELVGRVVAACREEAARLQSPDPGRAAELAARVARLDRQVRFVLDNPGESDADRAESAARLRELRRSRAEVQAALDVAAAEAARPATIPTEGEVHGLIEGMAGVLVAAAGGAGADAAPVRELIDQLTGGRIELEQVGERRAQGGWLRGRFRCPLVAVVSAGLGGRPAGAGDAPWVEVDYRADHGPDPSLAREVNERYDAGRLIGQIADELRLPRSVVTAVLDARFAAEGRERPDWRARRSGLTAKHVEPPTYQAVADRVKELADGGLLFGRIASELGLDRNTITAAWRYWHESRGLPVPDGRSRRKVLAVETTGSGFRVPVGTDQPADTGNC